METLTARTVQVLKARILNGTFTPGMKLPTLKELATEFGVSRTVIREAVAALRSDGLLQARHGVGIFALDIPASPEADLPPENGFAFFSRSTASFLDLLELRMSFEIHAAGLAATRRSWSQEANIWEAITQFEASLDDREALDRFDFAFHRAIAEATNNTAFIEFFGIMSSRIMPQRAFSHEESAALITDAYIEKTVTEHRAICEAVSAGNAELAREAMRSHLEKSHLRYLGRTERGLSHHATAVYKAPIGEQS